MCEPVTIAMGAMGMASSIVGGMGARKQARADAAYARKLAIHNNNKYRRNVEYQYDLGRWQQDRYYKNAGSAMESANSQYSAVLGAADQLRDRTLQGIAKAGRHATKGRAFVKVSASESGTSGNSVRLAAQQYTLAEARFADASFQNLKAQLRQSERQLAGIQARTQGRINAAMPQPMGPIDPAAPVQAIHQPSMLPYMLQAATAVIGAAAYQQGLDAMRG